MITFLVSGLAAGAMHVIMGPDHLAAIAPLALFQNKKSSLLGVRWGMGHAGGVILVAIIARFVSQLFSIELFSAHCERAVGVMLIAIGFWGLLRALKFELHLHQHIHDGLSHHHVHAHIANQRHPSQHSHTHAAIGIGILHGLAGSSHFLGVLPALAMPTTIATVTYLVAFGIGTILAMAIFSHLVGRVGSKVKLTNVKYFRGLLSSVACTTMAIGGYWLFV